MAKQDPHRISLMHLAKLVENYFSNPSPVNMNRLRRLSKTITQ